MRVSLGFRPRPSLSASLAASLEAPQTVSLGFRPRPSLSVGIREIPVNCHEWVSLGFRPRPSLSVDDALPPGGFDRGVAGVSAPAFVERRRQQTRRPGSPRVAGVSAPAFVERDGQAIVPINHEAVSLGFRPRPSLSGLHGAGVDPRCVAVSLGFRPRPSLSAVAGPQSVGRRPQGVAGVSAPAFVERILNEPQKMV